MNHVSQQHYLRTTPDQLPYLQRAEQTCGTATEITGDAEGGGVTDHIQPIANTASRVIGFRRLLDESITQIHKNESEQVLTAPMCWRLHFRICGSQPNSPNSVGRIGVNYDRFSCRHQQFLKMLILGHFCTVCPEGQTRST